LHSNSYKVNSFAQTWECASFKLKGKEGATVINGIKRQGKPVHKEHGMLA